jgi:hypothetical protein
MTSRRNQDAIGPQAASYRTLGAVTGVVHGDPDALARDLFDVEIAEADAWGEGLPAGAARSWGEASETIKNRFRALAHARAASI